MHFPPHEPFEAIFLITASMSSSVLFIDSFSWDDFFYYNISVCGMCLFVLYSLLLYIIRLDPALFRIYLHILSSFV